MSGKSPEWVNLMLDDPSDVTLPSTLEKLTKKARALATKRTKQLGLPDAHALRVAGLAAEIAYRLGFSKDEIEIVVEARSCTTSARLRCRSRSSTSPAS